MEAQFTINSIVIIVILIFPGVIFKRFYYQGQFTKQFGAGLFADRLITSFFWGILVQIITFILFIKFSSFSYQALKGHIDQYYTDIAANRIPNLSYQQLQYIFGYLGFLMLVAALFGHLAHQFIRLFKLDINYTVFRFANRWNYIVRGDILSSREFKGAKRGKVLTTMVDIVFDDGSEVNKMIQGFLTDYIISEKTGELEVITLTGANKWSEKDKDFKPIPGHLLILPYSKIINMNIRYNIQERVIDRILIIGRIINILLMVSSAFFVVFPWFLNIPVINKILFVIVSLLDLTLISVLLSWAFKTISTEKVSRGTYVIMLVMILLLLWACLLLSHTSLSIEPITDLFKT